jgi:transcriptional regulator with XRE-family HTH domain
MANDNSDLLDSRPRQKSPSTQLRRARLARKLAQTDLAFVSGVSVSWISVLERRPELMSRSVAERLARALGVTADELMPAAAIDPAAPLPAAGERRDSGSGASDPGDRP